MTVPIILGKAVNFCSHHFGSVCWLLFPFFGSGCWFLFLLLWIRLLVNVPIILDQAVHYCSHYFGLGCWLLFPLFWIMLLVTVSIILN